jgi:hypothetical protein
MPLVSVRTLYTPGRPSAAHPSQIPCVGLPLVCGGAEMTFRSWPTNSIAPLEAEQEILILWLSS